MGGQRRLAAHIDAVDPHAAAQIAGGIPVHGRREPGADIDRPARVRHRGGNRPRKRCLVGIAAVDSTVQIGGEAVATGRTISLPIPAPATLVSGPVVVRGSNGRPSKTYRFIQVKE